MNEAAKTEMQLEADRRARAVQGDQDAINAAEDHKQEVHFYPDGSSRFGRPPFPEKSPLEDVAEEKRAQRPVQVPPGMKTSGAVEAATAANTTESEFAERVERQLEQDVIAGKDPNTPNPTTSSDKPELAGTAGDVPLEADVVLGDNPTAEDLARIAANINPTGEAVKDATPEQVEAAAAQVLRETKGPVVSDASAEKAHKDAKDKATGKK